MKKNKALLPVFCAVCVLAVIGMILALTMSGKSKTDAAFTPPAFDGAAQSGMPEVSDESWTKIHQEGMSFSAYVCGNVTVVDGKADVYFTNVAENAVWMKLRIMDTDGNILGETGLLKPGEYVQSVAFETVPDVGQALKLKIMAYEPSTYYSAGAVSLNTSVSR